MAEGQSSYWWDKDGDGIGGTYVDGEIVKDDEDVYYYDLTTKTGDRAEINGAIFLTSQPNTSSGTGLIQAFVRVQDGGGGPGDGVEDGYNTDARPLYQEENTSPSFTTNLSLADVPIVTLADGEQYYEFRLDINQLNSGQYLSLDELVLMINLNDSGSDGGDVSGFADLNDDGIIDPEFLAANGLTVVYDLDENGNNSILLDYSLQAGSGKSDMFFYVPLSSFTPEQNANPEDYNLTLYSKFGETGTIEDGSLVSLNDSANAALEYDGSDANDDPTALDGEDYFTNDGFEEWSVSKVPDGEIVFGHKWEDADGDGVWDDGESGLAGVSISYEVYVWVGNNNTGDWELIDSGVTVTGTDGYYEFGIQPVGKNNNTEYQVKLTEVVGEDWINTYDGDGTADKTTTFTFTQKQLTDGDIFGAFGATETMNFANFELFDISGYKYIDTDGSGSLEDDETSGVVGVRIYIDDNGEAGFQWVDGNENGVWDAGEGDRWTVTGAGGAWSFTGLGPEYIGLKIYEDLSYNDIGDDYYQTVGEEGLTISTTSGQDVSGLKFGNVEYGSISGTKFIDADGVEGGTDQTPYSYDPDDPEDPHAGGWTIYLYDGDPDDGGLLLDTTSTDEFGNYSFEGLPLGTYWVLENTSDGDWTAVGATKIEVVGTDTSGFDITGQDFANFELFDVSGYKWVDTNGNGSWDSGEPGKEDWTIYLAIDTDADEVPDTVIDSVQTGSDGSYSFEGLGPGTYYIYADESVDGWSKTYGPTAVVVGASGVDVSSVIETTAELNFGNFADMFISGYKWADANNNTLWDESTTATLGGWTIVLDVDQDPDNGNEIAVAVTNGNPLVDANGDGVLNEYDMGYYEFTIDYSMIEGLGVTTLYVYEIQQDGFTQTSGMDFSFEISSGFTVQGVLGQEGDGNFGNNMMCGANRTPGFWQSTLGKSFYDGIADNQGDANGDGVPDGNKNFEEEGWTEVDLFLTYAKDIDGNGTPDKFEIWGDGDNVVEEGEIFLTIQQLQSWVSGGPKGGGNDFVSILERDVAASFLNTLNNNEVCGDGGDPAIDSEIIDSYEDAITFILKYDPDFNGIDNGGKKSQQGDWRAFGSDAHNELAAYNESGEAMIDGAFKQIAMDGDDYSSSLVQGYLDTLAKIEAESYHDMGSALPPEDLSMLSQTNLMV